MGGDTAVRWDGEEALVRNHGVLKQGVGVSLEVDVWGGEMMGSGGKGRSPCCPVTEIRSTGREQD